MKKPFIVKTLPKELQKLYKDYKSDCVYILEQLQKIYDYNNVEDVNILLFYSYFEIECTLKIYVDDLLPAVQKVISRFDTVEKMLETEAFLASLMRIRTKAIREKRRIDKLVEKDFNLLDLSQKKDIAYAISNTGKHKGLAAKYFLKIYQETNDLHYFGCYVNCLYASGARAEAVAQFDIILKSPILGVKEVFQSIIYQDLLDYYQDDKTSFRRIWNEAKDVCEEFPVSLECFTPILETAYKFGFKDICLEVMNLMQKEKIFVAIEIREADLFKEN